MNIKQVSYIYQYMLNVDPLPGLDLLKPRTLNTFDLCESKLELMYLLGAFYFMNKTSVEAGHGEIGGERLWHERIPYGGKMYDAVWVMDPWPGFYVPWTAGGWGGPSALYFVPQLWYKNIYRHDFGLFMAGDNGGGPPFSFQGVVEIDGYNVHRNQREKDLHRDKSLSCSVIRLREELDDPLLWFGQVVAPYAGWSKGDYIYWLSLQSDAEKEAFEKERAFQ